jgi:hypothetical protein
MRMMGIRITKEIKEELEKDLNVPNVAPLLRLKMVNSG